jgi:hypothetical protein
VIDALFNVAGTVIECARQQSGKALYVAFAFLAGTRPSEQLGLLWEDVDFEANVIHVRRMQEREGTLAEFTKTVAGNREIPICGVLRSLLLAWRVKCPRLNGGLHRVFPGFGKPAPWPAPRSGGGPLLYSNFRSRVWAPTLRRLGLPAVTPHSARHSFISTMQAQGIEVGLVAKIAGHANASVTLGHYTQAVRGGQDALAALERHSPRRESDGPCVGPASLHCDHRQLFPKPKVTDSSPVGTCHTQNYFESSIAEWQIISRATRDAPTKRTSLERERVSPFDPKRTSRR